MEDEKRTEIKTLIESLWGDVDDKPTDDRLALAKQIEEGYIFGEYANNEHYNIDDIKAIVAEVYQEKNPVEEGELVEE